MTTLKQLYCLQEVDLDLDGLNGQIAEVERELEGRLSLDKMRNPWKRPKPGCRKFRSSHRQLQLETESQRERCSHLETQLYGGDLDNPRDLEGAATGGEQRPAHAGAMDVRLLELSLQAEDARSQISAQEQQLTDTQAAWEVRQAHCGSNWRN